MGESSTSYWNERARSAIINVLACKSFIFFARRGRGQAVLIYLFHQKIERIYRVAVCADKGARIVGADGKYLLARNRAALDARVGDARRRKQLFEYRFDFLHSGDSITERLPVQKLDFLIETPAGRGFLQYHRHIARHSA